MGAFPRRVAARAFIVALSIWLACCGAADAWSLKTHIWVAQQVLNEALGGSVTIAGRTYTVPPHVVAALRKHPDRYRMGSLGPDVFPDPVVGQMTTHPGVKGGWQTDDWLQHVLAGAKGPEEIAFAFGFVAHAASDIFAHSYVNMYAGDIFLLTSKDSKREVELRHFVLEKYIESVTPHPASGGKPLDWDNGLGSPAAFLRDTLISGGDVSRENARSGAGYHLTAMHEVRRAVSELQNGTQDVIGRLTREGTKYFEQEAKLKIDLAAGKVQIDAAKKGIAAQEAVVKSKRDAYEAALRARKEADEIVQKHPELITANEQVLADRIKDVTEATAKAAKIAAEAASALPSLEDGLSQFNKRVDEVCGFIELPGCNDAKNAVKDAKAKINSWNLQKQLTEKAQKDAETAHDEISKTIDRLRTERNKALKDIAEKTYEAQAQIAQREQQFEQTRLDDQKRALAKLESESDRLSKELEKLTPTINDIKKAVDRYNPVTLIIGRWLDDIDTAMSEYIKASHRAGVIMLSNQGNPLKEYQDWWACYGQVFKAIPKEIGQAGCLVQRFVEDVQDAFNRAIDGLPEIVRWIISPTREVERKVKDKVEPELKKATFQIVVFLTDPRTREFLELLSHPKNATRDKLIEVYRKDESRKGLITFPDVASIVEQDLNIQGGLLAPDKFLPLTHAVTLTKLSLLAPDQLNQLMRDLSGNAGLADLYPAQGGNFTLLLDAVRSIDGNHQWQGYGLPYPRRKGLYGNDPGDYPYGEDGFKNKSKGFRFWTDEYLRERVFLKLFPGGVIGALGGLDELSAQYYKFPACPQNPYPSTQYSDGSIRSENFTCTGVSHPERPIADNPMATAAEYRDRYFQCGKALAELPHWTVAGSYRNKSVAYRDAEAIRTSFPDMTVEVWRPEHHNKYWTIMAAACTSQDRAEEARDIVVRRGIARDAFIWQPHLPWGSVEMKGGGMAGGSPLQNKPCPARRVWRAVPPEVDIRRIRLANTPCGEYHRGPPILAPRR